MGKNFKELAEEKERIDNELMALPEYKLLRIVYDLAREADSEIKKLEQEKLPHTDAIGQLNFKIKKQEEIIDAAKAQAEMLLRGVETQSGYTRMPFKDGGGAHLRTSAVTYDVVSIDAVPEEFIKKDLDKSKLNKAIKDNRIDIGAAANWLQVVPGKTTAVFL